MLRWPLGLPLGSILAPWLIIVASFKLHRFAIDLIRSGYRIEPLSNVFVTHDGRGVLRWFSDSFAPGLTLYGLGR